METEPPDPPKDLMREMCIGQGYVPSGCYLTGMIVFRIIQQGGDPCKGCNLDRGICGGRPKGERGMME